MHALGQNRIVVPAMKQHQHIVGHRIMGVAVDRNHKIGVVDVGFLSDGRQGAVVNGAVLHTRHDHPRAFRFQQLPQVKGFDQIALRLPETCGIPQCEGGQGHIPVVRVEPPMARIDINPDTLQGLSKDHQGSYPHQEN